MGSAAIRYPEPTCTVCGCTEFKACIGGPSGTCWWETLDRKTNAGLCSMCVGKKRRTIDLKLDRPLRPRLRGGARGKPDRGHPWRNRPNRPAGSGGKGRR